MRKLHAVVVAPVLILFCLACVCILTGCGGNRWSFDKTNLVTILDGGKVLQIKLHCETPSDLMSRDSFLTVANHLTQELDLFLGVGKDRYMIEDVPQPTDPNEMEIVFDLRKEIVNYTVKSFVTARNAEPGKKVGNYSLAQSGWTWHELHRRWGVEE